MTDAERKRIVVNALVYAADLHQAKRPLPAKYDFRPAGSSEKITVRYKDFVYPWARRLLPHHFVDMMVLKVDEAGKLTGELDLGHFYDEIWRNKNEEILTGLTREETAPRESDKINKQFDDGLASEQKAAQQEDQTKKEDKKPEKATEEKEKLKEEPKVEEKTETKLAAEKEPADESKPEATVVTEGEKQAERVQEKGWVEKAGKLPQPTKKETIPAKPRFVMVGSQRIDLEKPRQSIKKLPPKQRAQVLKTAINQPRTVPVKPVVTTSQPGGVGGGSQFAPRNKYANVPVPVPPFPQRLKLLKNIPIPGPVKDASSWIQRKTHIQIHRIPTMKVFSAAILGMVGLVAAGPTGALAGAGIGLAGANLLASKFAGGTNFGLGQPLDEEPMVEEPIQALPEARQVSFQPEPIEADSGTSPNVPAQNTVVGGPVSFPRPLSPFRMPGGGRGGGSVFGRGNQNHPARNATNQVAQRLAKEAAKKLASAAAEAAAAASWEVWAVVGGIIAILIIFMMIFKPGGGGTLESTSLCPPYPPYNGSCSAGAGGGAVNVPPNGSLLACTFTAGVSGQTQIQIVNPDLANYISDVANTVGIPPSVLAGILAIEHGSSLSSTDPQYFANDYDNTPSFTGAAFGFAQFEPATFEGVFNGHRAELSQIFHKDSVDSDPTTLQQTPPPNDSTMRITSIRDSIVMAAYKIRDDKNAAVGPDAPWDEAAVEAVGGAYQGSCSENNYCANLVASFQSCNTTSNLAGSTHPTPPPTTLSLADAIQQEFGITFIGFDSYQNQLEWAREKLWDVSNTNLIKYVRGTTIRETDQSLSLTSCSGSSGEMLLHPWTNKDFFKFLLSHELGHVVQSCAGQGVEAHNSALAAEGYISFYAANAPACNGIQPPNNNLEDYADMVGYYLNPNAGYSAAPSVCNPPSNPDNPYNNNGFPLHHSVVQSVLGNY